MRAKTKSKVRRSYHTFKRYLADHEAGDPPPIKVRALCLSGVSILTLVLTEPHIQEALRLLGQADGQNCAGGVCVKKHKKLFGHPVTGLVDWWKKFVYVHAGQNEKGREICYVYAHYDNIEALFDGTEADIRRLLRQAREKKGIKITLYPKKRGYHPRTGESLRVSKTSGNSGKNRKIQIVGNDLRFLNYMSAHAIPAVKVTAAA
jgi:hypothetical protein